MVVTYPISIISRYTSIQTTFTVLAGVDAALKRRKSKRTIPLIARRRETASIQAIHEGSIVID